MQSCDFSISILRVDRSSPLVSTRWSDSSYVFEVFIRICHFYRYIRSFYNRSVVYCPHRVVAAVERFWPQRPHFDAGRRKDSGRTLPVLVQVLGFTSLVIALYSLPLLVSFYLNTMLLFSPRSYTRPRVGFEPILNRMQFSHGSWELLITLLPLDCLKREGHTAHTDGTRFELQVLNELFLSFVEVF